MPGSAGPRPTHIYGSGEMQAPQMWILNQTYQGHNGGTAQSFYINYKTILNFASFVSRRRPARRSF